MIHRTRLDRSHTLCFPKRLDDCIAPENLIRFLDAFVASLNSAKPGLAETRYAAPETLHESAIRGSGQPSND